MSMYRVRVCSYCPSETIFYCTSCGKDLCRPCKGKHMIDLDCYNHDVVLYRERYGYFIYPEYCEIHKDKIYNRWCDDCNFPFCDVCYVEKGGEHSGHDVQDLDTVYKKYREEYRKIIAEIRCEVLPNNRAILAGIEPDIAACETEIANLEEKMKEKAERLKKMIDEVLAKDCPKKLQQLEKELIDRLNRQCEDMEKHIAYLRDLVYKYEHSANKPAEFLCFLRDNPLTDIKDIPDSCTELPILKYNEEVTKEDVIKLLGEIKITEVGIRQAQNEHMLKMIPEVILLRSFMIEGVKSTRHISGVTSRKIWVSDRNNLILADESGKTLHQVKDKIDRESGAHTAREEEEELIYIDKKLNVKKLSKDNKTENIVVKREDNWEPLSVFCTLEKGDILVAMMIHSLAQAKVVCYDKDGKEEQTIQYDDKSDALYNIPRFITENHNGDVVVSNHMEASGTVVVTDSSGKHRFSFTGPPKESGFRPGGICVDGLGNILVCDEHTNSVQLIDKNGQFQRYLLTENDGIVKPRSLGYCNKDHVVLVGSASSGKITVHRHLNRQDYLAVPLLSEEELERKKKKKKKKKPETDTAE
ncbi:E3 ubiquitin-protein ligase TRIM71-like isoform X1 [Saccostrea cucullata]|uniref:E3 ubiquitin-protein ligase TRIM71-like isoform X1 n=1 Tax=Saccostrea cuccullata TaxID=36930 RepID=UPI002ED435EA